MLVASAASHGRSPYFPARNAGALINSLQANAVALLSERTRNGVSTTTTSVDNK